MTSTVLSNLKYEGGCYSHRVEVSVYKTHKGTITKYTSSSTDTQSSIRLFQIMFKYAKEANSKQSPNAALDHMDCLKRR